MLWYTVGAATRVATGTAMEAAIKKVFRAVTARVTELGAVVGAKPATEAGPATKTRPGTEAVPATRW